MKIDQRTVVFQSKNMKSIWVSSLFLRYQPFGSRGSPSSRSPMIFLWTWLVPPAMRPPGACSMPKASGPSSIVSAPARSPRNIALSNIISVIPNFIKLAAVEAMGP